MRGFQLTMMALTVAGLGGCASNPAPAQNSQSAPYVVDQRPSYGSSYCADCGTVSSVNERQIAGKPNVAGAVIGAIIGGVAGHQFGSGKGNTAATAGGAVVGGVVGSQVAKGDSSTVYDMVIRMDNNTTQTLTVAATGGLQAGSRVRVSGSHVVPI